MLQRVCSFSSHFDYTAHYQKAILNRLQIEQRKIDRLNKENAVSKQRIYDMRKHRYATFDHHLDTEISGSHALRNPSVANVVREVFFKLEQEGHIHLWCLTIMSNHVHVLFSLGDKSLREVMQLIKGRSAIECNRVLGQTGKFWQHESYDHVVRSVEFIRIVRYILLNPVKAKLVTSWQEYPWSYIDPTIMEVVIATMESAN